MRAKIVVYLPLLVLAGWVSHPGPAARPKSLNEDPSAFHARLASIGAVYRAGHYQEAGALYQQGYDAALRSGDLGYAGRFLTNVGACRFALHEYRSALDVFVEARRLAEAAGDLATAGALDTNISSLYGEMGDLDSAVQAAERGLARIASRGRPKLLIQLASLRARQDRMAEALRLFDDAIDAADSIGDRDA